MKQVLCLFVIFFVSVNLFAEIKITGFMKFAGNNPSDLAAVEVYDAEHRKERLSIAEVNQDGSYELVFTSKNIVFDVVFSYYTGRGGEYFELPAMYMLNQNYSIDVDMVYRTAEIGNIGMQKTRQYADTISVLQSNMDKSLELFSSDNSLAAAEELNSIRSIPLKKLDSLFFSAQEDDLKMFFAVNYVNFLCVDGTYSNGFNPNIINFITTNSPISYFSSIHFCLCEVESKIANKDLFLNRRFMNYFNFVGKKTDEYAVLCSNIVKHYMKRDDSIKAKIYYNVLLSNFSEHSVTSSIREQYKF